MEEMTAEEISSILESDLTPDEKSSILASYDWSKDVKLTPPSPIKLQIEHTKANTKKGKDDDRKSERNIGVEAQAKANANAKKKELVDPLGDEEISSILDSKLTSEEKSSLLMASNLIKDEPKTCSTPSTVDRKEKIQHKETRARPGHDAIHGHENGSLKCIYKGSSLFSQQAPAEDWYLSEDLKKHARFIAKEIKEPHINSEGGDVETIYKEEAICKKCYEYMFDEDNVLKDENVLKAKCKCKLALIHEQCAVQWTEEKGSECLACGEQIKYINVILTMATSSSTSPRKTVVGKREQPTYVSKRSSYCCFFA